MALPNIGMLAYDNTFAGATLSAPDPSAWPLPLANLQTDKIISEPARCNAITDLTKSQFLVNYGRRRRINFLSLYALTLSLDALIKLTALDEQLVGNPGGPFAVTTGWTATSGGAALSVVAGKLRVTSTVASESGRAQIATLAGQKYMLDIDAGAVSGGTGFVAVGSSPTLQDILTSNLASSARDSFTFTATGAATYIYLGNHSAGQWLDTAAIACRPVLFQQDWMAVHPRIYSTMDLDWTDDNFWTGKPTQKDLDSYGNNFYYLPEQGWSGMALKVELDDHTNPAGEFDVGFGFTARRLTPPVNYTPGSVQSLNFRTIADQAPSGHVVFDRRKSERTISFGWNLSQKVDAMRLYDIAVNNDVVDPVFFVPSPLDAKNIFRETFMGRLSQAPSLTSVKGVDLRKTQLQLTELVA